MEFNYSHPDCSTPLCTSLSQFYIPSVEKFACSSCQSTLFSNLGCISLTSIETVQESITSTGILLTQLESFLCEKVDHPWPQLTENLEEWKLKLQTSIDRLQDAYFLKRYGTTNTQGLPFQRHSKGSGLLEGPHPARQGLPRILSQEGERRSQ
jgi:hypothetical protein